ncbi:MAG: ROK family protein [Solobacterium sp.]|nr:ROK family protein [Solobacterium sp.]
MANSEKAKLAKVYLDWILSRPALDYTVSQYTDVHEKNRYQNVVLDTDYAQGLITFNPLKDFMVVELRITMKKDGKSMFYLHFDLNDLDHAKDLFLEMTESLRKLKTQEKIKVLLCCSSGITTSFFVEKLNGGVEFLSLNYDFSAVSYNNLYVRAFDADIILLAPQIGFRQWRVREILKDKTVLMIPAAIFAQYDVSAMFAFLEDEKRRREAEMQKRRTPMETMEFRSLPSILVLSVIVEYNMLRIVFRAYEHGEMLFEDEVIKEKYVLRDLEDMLDIVVKRMPDLHLICVNTPGVIYDGHLTFRSSNIWNVDVKKRFEARYGVPFLFQNDANAMALGYYSMQKEVRSLSFYFHPRAARTAGVGNVVNGQLIVGSHSLAGEMQYVNKVLAYSDDPANLARTPEGVLELVSKYLISIISSLDPQRIVIYCGMVANTVELRRKIAEVIQEEYIPELVKTDDVLEYMFIGGLVACSQYLSHKEQK